MQFSQNELNGVRQPNQLIKNMIGIKVWEHLTLVPILQKIFDELLEYFRKHVRPCFHPQPNDSVPVGGSDDQLDSVFGLALLEVFF